jgi:hypothetical protein
VQRQKQEQEQELQVNMLSELFSSWIPKAQAEEQQPAKEEKSEEGKEEAEAEPEEPEDVRTFGFLRLSKFAIVAGHKYYCSWAFIRNLTFC